MGSRGRVRVRVRMRGSVSCRMRTLPPPAPEKDPVAGRPPPPAAMGIPDGSVGHAALKPTRKVGCMATLLSPPVPKRHATLSYGQIIAAVKVARLRWAGFVESSASLLLLSFLDDLRPPFPSLVAVLGRRAGLVPPPVVLLLVRESRRTFIPGKRK
jgi:hypothetical protein